MKVTVKGWVLESVRKPEKAATDVVLYQAGERQNTVVRLADGKPVPEPGKDFSIEGDLLTWTTRNGGVGMMVSVR